MCANASHEKFPVFVAKIDAKGGCGILWAAAEFDVFFEEDLLTVRGHCSTLGHQFLVI